MQHVKNMIDQRRRRRADGRRSREPWAYFGSFGDDFLSEHDDEAGG